ncbi:NXPE family member 4-like [Haliotis rubra]|uniref:NXPE family member 4-like n=1 Tax=Haliotis rubra TaxID=36100 RepID=UPI001EE50D60|nr:NXPE family member 4-like [Haliotis rubra]
MLSVPRPRFVCLLVVLFVATSFVSWRRFDKIQILRQPYPSRTGHQKQSHGLEMHISDVEIDDTNRHASPRTSKMSIVNPELGYRLNETITVKIVLFDHKNRMKTRGGDMLIVWMRDQGKGAASAGTVTDHGNGTYTGTLPILWTGQAVIRAAMVASSEKMAFANREFRHGYRGKILICIFNTTTLTETTPGHMESRLLNKGKVCNLTDKHYGVPLYCDRPKKRGIQCDHWTGVNSLKYVGLNQKNNSKWYFSSAGPQILPDVVRVNISTAQDTSLSAKIQCSRASVRSSWVSKPVGFFYNSTWHPLECFIDVSVKDYNRCLTNRTLRMFGDSTCNVITQIMFFLYTSNRRVVVTVQEIGVAHPPSINGNSLI